MMNNCYSRNEAYFTKIAISGLILCLIITGITGITSGLMIQQSVPDLVKDSDLIVTGLVIDTDSQWDEKHLNIQTITAIKVDNVLYGSADTGDSKESSRIGRGFELPYIP